jgi:hypothetical protein
MATRYEFLAAARITNIMQGLQDPRLLPQQLIWNQRIPDVPAMDEEIMARFVGQVLIDEDPQPQARHRDEPDDARAVAPA